MTKAKLPDALGDYVDQQLLIWDHFGCFLQELGGHISQGADRTAGVQRKLEDRRRTIREG
jgi:hypothetical protein